MPKNNLYEDIGYIKGQLQGIEKKLDDVCESVANNSKKIAKHDIVFGKIGIAITAGLFIMATGVNFLLDWIRNKLST